MVVASMRGEGYVPSRLMDRWKYSVPISEGVTGGKSGRVVVLGTLGT